MRRVFIMLLLMALANRLPCLAQTPGDREDFEEAIDRFNFNTIGYVLRDDKSNPAAQELAQRLSELRLNSQQLFEELRNAYKGNSRTEQLSRKIDSQKLNFNPSQPLKPQLDAVIQMIITDRQGKSYLPSLQQDLQHIRDQLLQRETVTTPYNAADNQILDDLNKRIAAIEQQQNASTEPTAATPMGMTVAIILLSFLTIINLAVALSIYKTQQKRSSKHPDSGKEELIRSYLDFELFPRLKEDRKYLEKQIAALREELQELKASQGIVGNTSDRKEFEDTIREKIKDIAPTEANDSAIREQEKRSNVPQGKHKNKHTAPVPIKKYADYPREEGFTEQQLSDSSDRRSIYEIKMVPGHDIATFTIVDDPAIHEYAIQNRERLLKDACEFEITSSKHTRIEVQQPGRLQKKGNNTWQVQTKAKIKFV